MSGPTFINIAAVADLLGQPTDHFLRVRADLEDHAGFPLPMPHWKRPMKWRRDQIEGWIEAQGRPRAVMPPPAMGHNVVRLIDHARQA